MIKAEASHNDQHNFKISDSNDSIFSLYKEDTISILSHAVKMERVSRQEQCIRNNRKYRKRKKEQFEYFKKMEKYFKDNHFESYHKFVEENSQENVDKMFESFGL